MDVPPFAATRPEGASDSRAEAEISAAPATKASLCHGKSSAFSLPAVYSRAAGWLSRFCIPAGVLRMRILYGGRVRFCVCRPPKSKKRRFTLTSCVFCRVRAWMFRPSRQLAPKGHRTAARRRKLAQPRQRKPRYVMGNRLLFHFRLCTAGRQGGFPGFVYQPVRPECRISMTSRAVRGEGCASSCHRAYV